MQKERRQFSNEIIRCDGFVSMPATAQALYFHLAASADDDGFTSQVKGCAFLAHATDEDIELLFKRGLMAKTEKNDIEGVTVELWRASHD